MRTSSPPEAYRKQLETNYSLEAAAGSGHAVHRTRRFNIKGRLGISALAARLCQFGADESIARPVVHENSVHHATDAVDHGAADDHKRRRASRMRPAALRAEDGPKKRRASPRPLAAKMPECPRRGHPECRAILVFLEAPSKFNELMLAFFWPDRKSRWEQSAALLDGRAHGRWIGLRSVPHVAREQNARGEPRGGQRGFSKLPPLRARRSD